MKIVIISFDDLHLIPDLFKPLIKKYNKDIKAVIIVSALPKKAFAPRFIFRQIEMMGIVSFTNIAIHYLINLMLTKAGFSKRSLKLLATKYNIKTYKIKSVNDTNTLLILKTIKPDIVIAQVPEKIKSAILNTAKIGFINKHSSLLPKYRGLEPVFWARLENEKNLGYTFHMMDVNIDTGRLLFQKPIDYNVSDSIYKIYKTIFNDAGKELVNLVTRIRNKEIKYLKLAGTGSYYSNPNKRDINKFRKKGLRYY